MRRLAIVVMLVAGCATVPPGVARVSGGVTKPGVVPFSDEQARDESACAPTGNEAAFFTCMKARGWTATTTYWYKAGGSAAAFATDHQQCGLAPSAVAGNLAPFVQAGIGVGRCLQARGWELRAGTP